MACIDKTYVNSWEQWKELRDWCWDKKFTLKNNITIKPRDYMYYPEYGETEVNDWLNEVRENGIRNYGWTKEQAREEADVPFWNTPTYLDIWLIRNCPIEFVQNRLKEQYNSSYESIKNGTSIYDTWKRNGLGKNFKYKVVKRPTEHNIHHFYYNDRNKSIRKYKDNRKTWWSVTIKDTKGNISWWANEDYGYWTCSEEALPFTSSTMDIQRKMPSLKSIIRMIQKWDLPDGTEIHFDSFRFNFGWTIIIHNK